MNTNIEYSTTIEVLVSHLNYGNHLGYDSLLSLLQEARLRWLKSLGAESEINISDGVGWMVKRVSLVYDAEAHHGDSLGITLKITETKRTSFIITHTVVNRTTDKSVCSGDIALVCFDFTRNKIARIPDLLALT